MWLDLAYCDSRCHIATCWLWLLAWEPGEKQEEEIASRPPLGSPAC